jgi:hypothetical protein
LQRDGERVEVEAPRTASGPAAVRQGPAIEELPDGIWYVDLERASWDEISQHLDRIAAAPGVVFDLRGYPNSNHQILSHLLASDDTSSAWMRIPRIIYPDHVRLVGYRELGWEMEAAPPRISGAVAFLTGPMAISYAESVMSLVEHYHLGEIVGAPTAGTNGNVVMVGLPGGFRATFTGMRVVKHDGSQHHLIGIRPTVEAGRTLAGIRAGRDEVLERGLEVVRAAAGRAGPGTNVEES